MFYKVCQEDCIACGLCQLKAPQLFTYDDEGIAHPTQNLYTPIPTDLLVSFKNAYIHCPTGAIKRSKKPLN